MRKLCLGGETWMVVTRETIRAGHTDSVSFTNYRFTRPRGVDLDEN